MKWQWFLGGRVMFWVSIIIFIALIISFILTYFIDITAYFYMKKQDVSPDIIKSMSEKYVSYCEITIDKPIIYRFVQYRNRKEVLLGTFHEWNNKYYIDISVNLCDSSELEDIVIHETRHMIVEYLKDNKIIDLTRYTEEIAEGENNYYNNLFNSGVYLLKNIQKEVD